MTLLFCLVNVSYRSYAQDHITLSSSPSLHSAGTATPKNTTTWCPSDVSSQHDIACNNGNDSIPEELTGLGQRGNLIAKTRERTLSILQSDNTCAAWFQESDPDAADIFRSLHYDVDATGPADIYSFRDSLGDLFFLHPWGARSIEYSGRSSFIQINGNGPFFVRKSRVTASDNRSAAVLPSEFIPVIIGLYVGATPEARITIMLHELGHIIGRLPRDDNSFDGRSSQNTSEVLRHCKKEIRQVARDDS